MCQPCTCPTTCADNTCKWGHACTHTQDQGSPAALLVKWLATTNLPAPDEYYMGLDKTSVEEVSPPPRRRDCSLRRPTETKPRIPPQLWAGCCMDVCGLHVCWHERKCVSPHMWIYMAECKRVTWWREVFICICLNKTPNGFYSSRLFIMYRWILFQSLGLWEEDFWA